MLIQFLLDDFAKWWDESHPGDPGYYVAKQGIIYKDGILSADDGFKHLERMTEDARKMYSRDALAEASKMSILWALFAAIPADWPLKRRMYLSNSISRYMAELD